MGGDPSTELAPYTSDRLRDVLSAGFAGPSPRLWAPLRVLAVDANADGGYDVAAEWQAPTAEELALESSSFPCELPGMPKEIKILRTAHPPILCTGFEGSVVQPPVCHL